MKKISLRATALAVAALAAGQAWATNGMLMEGYGPVALSMGGAGQAYDTGTAALMNNPATLMLGSNGTQADVAVGVLGPNVSVMGQKSDGTSYVMPAVGWVRKNDQFAYGVGVFGQGGMGTEFGANAGNMANMRSEVAVGRVIFPFSYKVNSQLSVGATLDYSWASMDMKMGTSLDNMQSMVAAGGAGQMMAGVMTASNAVSGRISFSNSSDFSGAASSTGWAGKIGLVFEPSEQLSLGLTYSPKTHLANMKTNASGAQLTLYSDANGTVATAPDGNGGTMSLDMTGRMTVNDFQMPAIVSAGFAFKPSSRLMLVGEVKSINWSDVMEKFSMSFDAGAMGVTNFAMVQNWKDQTVVSLGGAYQMNDALVFRAGYSHSTNPVPDGTVHPLFPAIVKNHYTAGFGYQIDKSMTLNAAVSHAPKVSVVNSTDSTPISHSQTNYQLMLSYRY